MAKKIRVHRKEWVMTTRYNEEYKCDETYRTLQDIVTCKCSECNKTVDEKAKKCRYCNSEFTDTSDTFLGIT